MTAHDQKTVNEMAEAVAQEHHGEEDTPGLERGAYLLALVLVGALVGAGIAFGPAGTAMVAVALAILSLITLVILTK